MKQLTCEMCGSTDLIKRDGVFVCQACGCKYSIEEAKKMMVEGTVAVQGTVKVDTSEKLNNLYQVARRAKADNNNEMAAKYYDMILIEDPISWEASFYSVYFKSMLCTVGEIPSAATSISNCLPSVLGLLKQTESDEEKLQQTVTDIYRDATDVAALFIQVAKSSFLNVDIEYRIRYLQDLDTRSFAAAGIAFTLGTAIDDVFGSSLWAQEMVLSAYEEGKKLLGSSNAAAIHVDLFNMGNSLKFARKIDSFTSPYSKKQEETKRKIEEIKAKKRDDYWAAHTKEKADLQSEMKSLEDQISALEAEKKSLPELAEAVTLRERIQQLTVQCDSLGLFKGKEKRALKEQIDTATNGLSTIQAKVDKATSEIQVKIDPLQKRVAEIDEELTRDR